MITPEEANAEPSWYDLVARQGMLSHRVAAECPDLSPYDRQAEVMRRLLTEPASPFVTKANSKYSVESWAAVCRTRLATRDARIRELETELHELRSTGVREVAKGLAKSLRERADDPYRVKGKLKREGVLLAAEWLDPK